ncbi:hypothetical protein ACFL3V_03625 [Nanoarchaeota archaeon]
MSFFMSDNPIALFCALVVVVVVLKLVLAKHKWFAGGNAAYITYVLIGVIVLLLAYRPLLRMLSIGVPLAVLFLLFTLGICALLLALGMPQGTIWNTLRNIGPFKLIMQIAIVCIIAFAASQVYGAKLLEDKSVSFADSMIPEEKAVKVDFAPIFSKNALGLIMLTVVLGFAFVFVNFAK